jgi:Cysteine-rich CPCC
VASGARLRCAIGVRVARRLLDHQRVSEDAAAGRRVERGPHDDPALSDGEILARRTAWFQAYTSQRNVYAPTGPGMYSCPCCGHPTLGERGGYEICEVCGWEDDGQDNHDSSVIRGGPNGRDSLDDARARFAAGGGVRRPHTPPREPA